MTSGSAGDGGDREAAEPTAAPDGGSERLPAAEAETGGQASLGRTVRAWLDGEEDPLAALRDEDGEIRVSRREAMAYGAGAGAGVGGWRALHNVVLGYGVLVGTNIKEQPTAELAAENFGVRWGEFPVGGGIELRTNGEFVGAYEGESSLGGVSIGDGSDAARAVDERHGLAGAPVSQLHDDLVALRAGEATFAFSTVEPFLDRIEAAETRPATVEALRGPVFDQPDPSLVETVAGVHPSDAAGLIEGLKSGFRQHSGYDIPRYAAGSVEDNILLGALDLRQYFESPADFEALAAGENTGLFCTELVDRSIEAFHAVPATEQSPPILAGAVYDQRHKHSYTILASVVREDGDLVVPATVVDYTHSTLYDDLHLRWLLGEGLEAYNDRHRVTEIFWNSYASV